MKFNTASPLMEFVVMSYFVVCRLLPPDVTHISRFAIAGSSRPSARFPPCDVLAFYVNEPEDARPLRENATPNQIHCVSFG
ncbi:MAG: hypothetical protein WCA41_14705, partial [Candidatus Acidiferrum sp.]